MKRVEVGSVCSRGSLKVLAKPLSALPYRSEHAITSQTDSRWRVTISHLATACDCWKVLKPVFPDGMITAERYEIIVIWRWQTLLWRREWFFYVFVAFTTLKLIVMIINHRWPGRHWSAFYGLRELRSFSAGLSGSPRDGIQLLLGLCLHGTSLLEWTWRLRLSITFLMERICFILKIHRQIILLFRPSSSSSPPLLLSLGSTSKRQMRFFFPFTVPLRAPRV